MLVATHTLTQSYIRATYKKNVNDKLITAIAIKLYEK